MPRATEYAWMFHQSEKEDEGAQLKKDWFFSNLRAKNDREMKRDLFRYFLKNIRRFL